LLPEAIEVLVVILMDDELPHSTARPPLPPDPEGAAHKASYGVVCFSDLNLLAGLELCDEGW